MIAQGPFSVSLISGPLVAILTQSWKIAYGLTVVVPVPVMIG
jgi:hypothetical protein